MAGFHPLWYLPSLHDLNSALSSSLFSAPFPSSSSALPPRSSPSSALQFWGHGSRHVVLQPPSRGWKSADHRFGIGASWSWFFVHSCRISWCVSRFWWAYREFWVVVARSFDLRWGLAFFSHPYLFKVGFFVWTEKWTNRMYMLEEGRWMILLNYRRREADD